MPVTEKKISQNIRFTLHCEPTVSYENNTPRRPLF